MIAYRELYCPAHFGNSYEVMWPREMRQVLSEAIHWGFNTYGDWFDFADLKAPWDNPRDAYLLPQALWERKLTNWRTAADLGYASDLVITPNHVFLNQLDDALLADTSQKRFFGQLLCPSKPKAREIILDNYRAIFRDLLEHDICLDSISGGPFDYGGCACADCDPWIVTFGKLFAEIHDLAKRFFPKIAARLVGWWWTREEHGIFKQWADSAEPGRFSSLAAHIPYGEITPDPLSPLPEGCARHAFVHIGYGDKAKPRDVYGAWGPAVAPIRISKTVSELSATGYEGFMAYSEGVFDDINKALLAGLSSELFSDVRSVLEAYSERYLGASGQEKEAWATWIAQWGEPFKVDTQIARREFEQLAKGIRTGWRLAQLEAKLGIFEAHAAVRAATSWDESRLAAAERFFAKREHLQRDIWGLGLVREVLNERFHRPDWFDEWQSHRAARLATSSQDTLPEA